MFRVENFWFPRNEWNVKHINMGKDIIERSRIEWMNALLVQCLVSLLVLNPCSWISSLSQSISFYQFCLLNSFLDFPSVSPLSFFLQIDWKSQPNCDVVGLVLWHFMLQQEKIYTGIISFMIKPFSFVLINLNMFLIFSKIVTLLVMPGIMFLDSKVALYLRILVWTSSPSYLIVLSLSIWWLICN